MNTNFLKGQIVKAGDTQRALAESMGISLGTLNAKINEKNSVFTRNEIAFIAKRYKLSPSEIFDIFFCEYYFGNQNFNKIIFGV